MRVQQPSRIAIAILAIPLLYIGYKVFEERSVDWAYWILLPIVPMVALLILGPQVDYWWHTKHPMPLDERLLDWIIKNDRFFQQLSREDKDKYLYRMSLYLEARIFENVGGDDMHKVPDDIQCMIASQAIQVAFHREDFLIGEFDRIYTYKHPFPSPKRKYLHTLETDGEDGVIILALDYALVGVMQNEQYYNITSHAYCEAQIKAQPSYPWPTIADEKWETITACLGFTAKQISDVLGFDPLDLLPVALMTYLQNPEKMLAVDPGLHQQMEQAYLNR